MFFIKNLLLEIMYWQDKSMYMCQGQFERTLNSFEQVLAKKFAKNTQQSFMVKVAAGKIWRESIEGNSFSILSKVW